MLRITAGKFKNFQLNVPKDITRPITDRIRISMFDTVSEFIPDADVLDLFSGTGACGLEAISRGAKSAVLVDKNEKSIDVIKQNIAKCGCEKKVRVITLDAWKFVKNCTDLFDLIFLDPSFIDLNYIDIGLLRKCLKEGGIVIARLPSTLDKENNIKHKGLKEEYSKDFGKSQVIFYRQTAIAK